MVSTMDVAVAPKTRIQKYRRSHLLAQFTAYSPGISFFPSFANNNKATHNR